MGSYNVLDRTEEHNNIDRIIANKLFDVPILSQEEIKNQFEEHWKKYPSTLSLPFRIEKDKWFTSDFGFKNTLVLRNTELEVANRQFGNIYFHSEKNEFRQIFPPYSQYETHIHEALERFIKKFDAKFKMISKKDFYFGEIGLKDIWFSDNAKHFSLCVGRVLGKALEWIDRNENKDSNP